MRGAARLASGLRLGISASRNVACELGGHGMSSSATSASGGMGRKIGSLALLGLPAAAIAYGFAASSSPSSLLLSPAAADAGAGGAPSARGNLVVELPDGARVIVIAPHGAQGGDQMRVHKLATAEAVAAAPDVGVGPFTLEPLPWPLDALEPHMSRETLSFHWGKHHKTYVENLNKQLSGSKELQALGGDLEKVVIATWNNGSSPHPAFNNAAQVWNHSFFWRCMKPGGGGAPPPGPLADAIARDFGSFGAFREQLKTAGLTQFGSGWAWLVTDPAGKLAVLKTPNAACPITSDGLTPLLTVDVWEHAYYLDYQNQRAAYIDTFLDNLVDWGSAAKRYEAAVAAAAPRASAAAASTTAAAKHGAAASGAKPPAASHK